MKSTWPMPAPRVGDPTPPLFHLLVLVGVGIGGNANQSVRAGDNANLSKSVALRTQREWFLVAVEYRLYMLQDYEKKDPPTKGPFKPHRFSSNMRYSPRISKDFLLSSKCWENIQIQRFTYTYLSNKTK